MTPQIWIPLLSGEPWSFMLITLHHKISLCIFCCLNHFFHWEKCSKFLFNAIISDHVSVFCDKELLEKKMTCVCMCVYRVVTTNWVETAMLEHPVVQSNREQVHESRKFNSYRSIWWIIDMVKKLMQTISVDTVEDKCFWEVYIAL